MKRLINRLLFFLLLKHIFCIASVAAQELDSTGIHQAKKIKILPLPTFGYEPETKTRVGAVCLITIDLHHDSLTRQSNAKLEFNYTFRNQVILETEWNYFSKHEKWYTDGLLHLSVYPDLYYGVGPETPLTNELLFTTNRFNSEFGFYRNLGNQRFLGSGLRYYRYSQLSSDSTNEFTELTNAQNVGIKFSWFKDSRNSLLNATDGLFARFEIECNFSEANYWRLTSDVRKYFSNDRKLTLSTRLLNRFVFNTPNFYDYSVMGGDDFVRGYFYGRYRDKNLTTIQAEIRTPQRFRFGLAAIGGLSTIYPNFNKFGKVTRPNYGLGLRYLIDKEDNINLRLDYVLGSENNSGFYISFGESF